MPPSTVMSAGKRTRDFRAAYDRRTVLSVGAAGLLSLLSSGASAEPLPLPPGGFGFDDVVDIARLNAAKDHSPLKMALRPPLADLNYDEYRAIRVNEPLRPLGQNGNRTFALDLLPPGHVYRDPVGITVVHRDRMETVPFSFDHFRFDPPYFEGRDVVAEIGGTEGLNYSGFRLRHPLNSPDVLDEFVVFQGASYFRAVARNLGYGLAARGLALRTADPRGEEFPVFRHFWVVEPEPGDREIVVHALLDSQSCTGAFMYEISPGETTVMNVRCKIFPRIELVQTGIAPLTSMYFFGPERRAGIDDFRDAVHDSSGLQMITGDGTRLWRPLSNPRRVEVSAFQDDNPKGFGLTQRSRDFDYYQDAEARYDLRPSCWVEPLSDWGPGAVMLVEIPVENEFNDNVVSFWRPEQPLLPMEAGHDFVYRLHWCDEPPDSAPMARIHATRVGRSIHTSEAQAIVIDFRKGSVNTDAVSPQAWVSTGEVKGLALRTLPGGDLVRASFKFFPGDATSAEMQLYLRREDARASETWLYRWTAK
ncbi:MAG: glucan biosynthesis protein [Pseudomonadota bacterium]